MKARGSFVNEFSEMRLTDAEPTSDHAHIPDFRYVSGKIFYDLVEHDHVRIANVELTYTKGPPAIILVHLSDNVPVAIYFPQRASVAVTSETKAHPEPHESQQLGAGPRSKVEKRKGFSTPQHCKFAGHVFAFALRARSNDLHPNVIRISIDFASSVTRHSKRVNYSSSSLCMRTWNSNFIRWTINLSTLER